MKASQKRALRKEEAKKGNGPATTAQITGLAKLVNEGPEEEDEESASPYTDHPGEEEQGAAFPSDFLSEQDEDDDEAWFSLSPSRPRVRGAQARSNQPARTRFQTAEWHS